ncbi:MAG: hypothetical protein JSR83_03830, partial [Proteobacteria bacterium]|nr:hypothetical protein [Pseudomonadota bacterium]
AADALIGDRRAGPEHTGQHGAEEGGKPEGRRMAAADHRSVLLENGHFLNDLEYLESGPAPGVVCRIGILVDHGQEEEFS